MSDLATLGVRYHVHAFRGGMEVYCQPSREGGICGEPQRPWWDKGLVFLELSVPKSSSQKNPDCICVFCVFKGVFTLVFPNLISNKVSYLE